MDIFTLYYTMLGISTLLVVLFVFAGPFAFFGIKLFIKRRTLGDNIGLIFFNNKSNNLRIPKIIDLRKETFTLKINKEKRDYPINREAMQGSRFFGCPFCIFNEDDVKTTLGFYYQHCDEKGEPLFYKSQDGTTIPVLSPVKPSVSLSPSFLDVLVNDRALTQALKELFSNNKKVFMLLIGIGLAIAFNAYVSYELLSNHIPAITSSLQSLASAIEALKAGGL